ncbi:signal protein [Rhodococcus sp. D2-41]|uniref:MHYT domain-containing protein n=1 Tax=Speluncibacter jeojiensis TaxID=2710754 RepID=UPI00240FBBD9|nr:MHYT domain-containing protein [Rhodococcus sp. D2-41]MDG3009250.1 signal protein [Rhodococcus sp. D2-41]
MSDHVDLFSLGVWVLFLAFVTSTIAAAVGFACARKSRYSLSVVRRWCWLAAAAMSIGGVAIWLVQLIVLVGFTVSGTKMRYDGTWVTVSLVLAVALALVGLLITGRREDRDGLEEQVRPSGTVEIARIVGGGVVIGAAVPVVHFTIVRGIHIQGSFGYAVPLAVESVAIGVVVGTLAVWLTLTAHNRYLRWAAAPVMALGVVGAHYVAMMAMQVDLDSAAVPPAGVEVFSILFPAFVAGTLVLTIPITALLTAPTRAESRLEEEAERWVVEEYAAQAEQPVG